MNTIQTGITTLLRSAITAEALPLPPEFRLEEAGELIRSHSMTTLIYEGAVRCGLDRETEAMERLLQGYCKLLMQSEGQMKLLSRLFALFESNGVDYLPLKGCNMKAMYPKPELRLMGDADVLIRQEQYGDRIAPLLESLGFQFQTESDHEIIWNHRDLHLELHKRLIPTYHQKLSAYFADIWSMAVRQSGCRHGLPGEEEFLYLLMHFAKHYRDGGIGCRHVVDLWVYLRANPGLDWEKVHGVLQGLGLLEFWKNLRQMMAVWFEDGQENETSAFLTAFIFSSGSWGSQEEHILSQGLRQRQTGTAGESRLRYVLRMAFPARNALLGEYPILRRHGWHLPFVWIWRLTRKLFTGGFKMAIHRKNLKLYTRENLDAKQTMLEFVGLRDWD